MHGRHLHERGCALLVQSPHTPSHPLTPPLQVATVMAPGLVRAPPNEQALMRVGVGLVVGLGDGAGCSSVYSAICGTCEYLYL